MIYHFRVSPEHFSKGSAYLEYLFFHKDTCCSVRIIIGINSSSFFETGKAEEVAYLAILLRFDKNLSLQ